MAARRSINLLQVTDLHLFEDPAEELYGVATWASFRAVQAKALAEAPTPIDAILVTGDVAEDGRRRTYEKFREVMAPLGVPVACIPGNHEEPEILAAIIGIPPLQYCGSLSFDGWRVVMLDSHRPGQDIGWLADSELARLDRELTIASGGHVLVALHHQPIPMGSPWLDTVGLKNGDALFDIVERHGNVRGIVWGHVHQASDRMHRGIRMMSTPSTCAQFTPDTQTCLMDLRPPGFRWLELTPAGGIETRVVWLEGWERTERPPDSRRLGMT